MASLVHSSVPEMAAEAFRSSSSLKGNLIKFLKVDGTSDVQGCSEGAPMVARFKVLAFENHTCEHVCVCLQLAFASVDRCDFSEHVCEVKAE